MAVNWLWKNKLGYIKYKTIWEGEEIYLKTILYAANCLGCEIYHNDKEHYTIMGFWNNEEHLKNMLGLTSKFKTNCYSREHNGVQDIIEIGLNTFFYKEAMIIAKNFAKRHYKIKLYYKEIK